jgi:hypothetical protein
MNRRAPHQFRSQLLHPHSEEPGRRFGHLFLNLRVCSTCLKLFHFRIRRVRSGLPCSYLAEPFQLRQALVDLLPHAAASSS